MSAPEPLRADPDEPKTVTLRVEGVLKYLAWVYVCLGSLTILVTLLALLVGLAPIP